MYSQAFLATNPEVLSANGSVNLGTLASGSMMVPQDVASAIRANNAESGTPSSSPTPSGATPTPTPSGSGTPSGALKSGASALASPRIVVALVAVAAAMFAL